MFDTSLLILLGTWNNFETKSDPRRESAPTTFSSSMVLNLDDDLLLLLLLSGLGIFSFSQKPICEEVPPRSSHALPIVGVTRRGGRGGAHPEGPRPMVQNIYDTGSSDSE